MPDPIPGTQFETEVAQARSRALRLLARRERCRAGLCRALLRAGVDEGTAELVVQDLAQHGLVDDLRFCRLYLGQETRLRPRSWRLLRRDLLREGCHPSDVEQGVAEVSAEVSEQDLALRAARAKLRAAAGDPDRFRRGLARRGFHRSTIEEAVRQLTEGPGGTRSRAGRPEESWSEEGVGEGP